MKLGHSDIALKLPVDERILPGNVALALAIAEDLEETMDSASQTFDILNETWKLFALYYGARIAGAYGANVVVRFHSFGREAAYMDRAVYEFFTKLLYYTTLRERAQEALRGMPKQHLKLIHKLNLEPAKFYTKELFEIVEQAPIYKADEQFRALRDELLADERLKKMAERRAVKWYLEEPEAQWNVYWIGTSQVVHGTIADVFASSKLDLEKQEVTGELSSRRPAPNGGLLDIAMYALFATRHIEEEFGLRESEHSKSLADGLADAMKAANTADGRK